MIGCYEEAWASSFLVRPGKANFFLIYKFDDMRVFKSEVSCDVSPRPLQIHHAVLPKSKYEIMPKPQQSLTMDNYYINFFYKWRETDPNLKTLIELDTNIWHLKGIAMFRNGHEDLYAALIYELKQFSREIMTIYKELLSNSESFPLLNSVEILQWCTNLKIIDGSFQANDFYAIFKEVKKESRKSVIQEKRRVQSKPSRRLSIESSVLSQKAKEEEEPELLITRYQWLDLLVRMAMKKFKQTDPSTVKLTPAQCLRRLTEENLIPFYHRLGKNPERYSDFVRKDLNEDKEIQKYVFLNQFELHKIYKQNLAENYDIVYYEEVRDAEKPKAKLSHRLNNKSINRLKKSRAIAEEDELSQYSDYETSPRMQKEKSSPGKPKASRKQSVIFQTS